MKYKPMNANDAARWPVRFFSALILAAGAAAQTHTTPVAILEVDTANRVDYWYDRYEPSRFGSSATPIGPQGLVSQPFLEVMSLADIVAVNGKPARGNLILRTFQTLSMSPNPSPGQAIGDITRGGFGTSAWEFQSADGRPVGSLFVSLLAGGSPPPGTIGPCNVGNQAVTGGTGAYLGAGGSVCQVPLQTPIASRSASVLEDPSIRRNTSRGTNRYIIQVIPLYLPQVALLDGRPVVFHADFSPVTDAAPARAGELLIVAATGLGPTDPMSRPGEPFGGEPFGTVLQAVTSPVEAIVNGQSVEVVNVVGWPGAVDRYRVDFRVPEGTAPGAAALQLSVAWMKGPQVSIPVRKAGSAQGGSRSCATE